MKKTLCLLILTVFLSISLCACNKPAYSKPIEAAIQMTYYGNEEFIKYAAPQEYFEWYEKEYDRKFENYCDDWENDQWLKMFGNDYKVTYEITNEEKVDRDTLDTIKEYLEDKYSIKPSHVKKAYSFDIEFFVKGSDDEDSSEWEDMYSVKIRNNWYLVKIYDYGGVDFCYDAW